jgi:putative phage-type endonuclease
MTGRIITLDSCCTWLDFEQGTPEWLQSRTGLLTASRMADALPAVKGGTTKTREGLKLELLAERFTGKPTEFFVNNAMRWGTDNEPLARQTYMEFTGNHVEQVGLALSTEIEFFGASVDGLVEDADVGAGNLEIKCPTSQTFFKWVIEGVVPEQHKPQMLAQMAVTGRKWADFVAFDPRYPPEQDLFIRRFVPHPQEIEDVKKAARQFLQEVAAMERMFLRARMV